MIAALSSANPPPSSHFGSKLLRWAGPLAGIVIFAAALWALDRDFRHVHWHELSSYIDRLPADRIVLAAGATLLSYLFLACSDFLGQKYVRQKLKFGAVALVSFISYAFSMNLGAAVVSGGAVRMRLYSALGLRTGEVARLIGFCAVAGICGQALLSGLVFTFYPMAVPRAVPFPTHTTLPLGVALLAFLAAIGGLALRGRPIVLRSWRVELPSVRLLAGATLTSALDWSCAVTTLIALLPTMPGVTWGHLVQIILLAHIAGVASTVPGGLGVFEYVVVSLLPASAPHAEVLGGLIAYRAVYYLIPFATATVLLGGREGLRGRIVATASSRRVLAALSSIVPTAVALGVMVSGSVLMLSGSTPALPERTAWLSSAVPLTVVETSHFLASIAGLLLLVLAWSLHRRVRAAWYLAVGLLAAGIVFSLLKGWDWEEALILATVLVMMVPARRRFTRHATLLATPFTMRWWGVLVLALGCATWLGFFAFRHVEYSSELWWQFSYDGHASRFLRASAGMAVLLAAIGLAQLLSPALHRRDIATEKPGEDVERIVAQSPNPEAGLALLGDKRFLFSRDRSAFIMYGAQRQSLIALGDPIGPEEAWEDLLWDFRDEADRRGARPVFYQVGEASAHRYIDLGLQLYKMGEEGRVPLADFNLEGSARKELRQTINKGRREGCTVEVVPRGASVALFPELRDISDAWLGGKNSREKRFSLGSFSPEYVAHFPLALVRRHGEIVAFSNLFCGAGRTGFSVDLMRFDPARAIHGTMPYLFTELMLWGREEGYGCFNLGVAPLSGLARRPLAPLWHRIGATLFSRGEHFYNFQGLRSFKEKFQPEWSGMYLATAGPMALPATLLDCAGLISGGFYGIVRK
ncbi:MAG: bifunctional lysylphosphatidylglycerol flippase/synthetase MprF [Spartobacteria bacterium]